MPENFEMVPTQDNTENVIEKKEKIVEIEQPIYDINKFRLTRILQNNSQRKSVALLGLFPDVSPNDQAIIVFEKQAFLESDVQTLDVSSEEEDNTKFSKKPLNYFNGGLTINTEFINNIYGSFQAVPCPELGSIKVTVVYPATEKHIEKYSITKKFLIRETPDLYNSITLPYLVSNQLTLDWVYNILEHKQETERIVFEDADQETGFILLPDLKWDGRNVDTLYLLAITHKRNIKSLRDLTGEHLPLLRNIRAKAAKAIEERYGLPANKLRFYFHYRPSFYHLHVHINPIQMDAPGIWCEKSHLLDTVITNLELLPDYYKRATLPFVLYGDMKMLEMYESSKEEPPSKRKKCE